MPVDPESTGFGETSGAMIRHRHGTQPNSRTGFCTQKEEVTARLTCHAGAESLNRRVF